MQNKRSFVEFEALLDSGSDVSILDEKMSSRVFDGPSGKSNVQLFGANSIPIEVTGKLNVGVTFDGRDKIFEGSFVIAKGLRHSVIIGKDFMTRHGMIIDFSNQLAKIESLSIPFDSPDVIRIKTFDAFSISAQSTIRIPVSIEETGDGNKKGNSIMIDGGFVNAGQTLFVPRCLIGDKRPMIEISNTSRGEVRFKAGEVVASGNRIREFSKATNTFFCNRIASHTVSVGVEHDFGEEEQKELADIVNKSGVIKEKLGRVDCLRHDIDTGDSPPINQRQYRSPIAKREAMRAEAEKMLIAGVIKPSKSAWNSPVVLVAKPNGETRFAIDFRRVNAVTKKEAYPVPRIDDCLNSLGTGKYFTTLDLESAYWQVPMSDVSKEKTAFSIEGMGHLEFEVMPYGLVNAGACFQRLMDLCLNGLHWTHCLVYLDDVIVFGSTLKEHNERLSLVLKRIADFGLTLKSGKCKWAKTSVKYLGHVISGGTISTDPSKTAAVREFPVPTSVTEVRSFLGLASYYRRFVPNFAEVCKPLTTLTKTKGAPKFRWTEEANIAFQSIKALLTEAPCLTCFNQNAPLIVQTDASNYGLGAVLCCEVDGEERVVAYASRQLKNSEMKYAPIMKECLAIVYALKTFHYYLYGQQYFAIFTDHCPLTYLKSMDPKSQLLMRWICIMQCYNFTVAHRAGSKNGNADALSRCPISWDSDEGKEMCPTFAEVCQVTADDIALLQDTDEELRGIKEFLQDGSLPEDEHARSKIRTHAPRYAVDGGILYHIWISGGPNKEAGRERKQLVVPKESRGSILLASHDNANHPGYLRTLSRIRETYFWPTLMKDTANHIKNCAVCKTIKSTKQNKVHLHPIRVSQPLELVSVDFVGPLPQTERGNKYIMTFQDQFSRWPAAYPVQEANSERVVDCIKKFGSDFGYPECILSDRGSNLISKMANKACKKLNIDRKLCASARPQTNGMLERWHFTLKNALATYPLDEWDLFVDDVTAAYRTTPHTETKETPALLFLGREINVSPDIEFRPPLRDYGDGYVETRVAMLQRAYQIVQGLNENTQLRNKRRYDRKAKAHSFGVNDWAWLKREDKDNGLDRVKWTGPYQITEVVGDQNVKLNLPRGNLQHPTVHVNRLKGDDSVQRVDIEGKISRVLENKKVRGLNGRLSNKSFVELEGGHTLWVPSTWVD